MTPKTPAGVSTQRPYSSSSAWRPSPRALPKSSTATSGLVLRTTPLLPERESTSLLPEREKLLPKPGQLPTPQPAGKKITPQPVGKKNRRRTETSRTGRTRRLCVECLPLRTRQTLEPLAWHWSHCLLSLPLWTRAGTRRVWKEWAGCVQRTRRVRNNKGVPLMHTNASP